MLRWSAGLALMACGSEAMVEPEPPPIDAPPFVPGPNVVELDLYGETPFYIRYRDGKGSWTEPHLDVGPVASVYRLHVTDTFEVILVCGDELFFDVSFLYRTFSDGPTSVYCAPPFDFAPAITHRVTGQMMQPGEVSFGGYAASQTGPWDFQLDLGEATYDLVAVAASGMVVRRGEVVDAPRTVPPIDIAQEGTALRTVPFTVNSEPNEMVSSSVAFFTQREFVLIEGSPTVLRAPPLSLIEPGDDLRANVQARTDTGSTESHYRAITGDLQSAYTLMPKLEARFEFPTIGLFVGWEELPDAYDEITLYLYGNNAGYLQATKAWMDATSVRALSFTDVPPDYEGDWKILIGGGFYCALTAYDNATGGATGATRTDNL